MRNIITCIITLFSFCSYSAAQDSIPEIESIDVLYYNYIFDLPISVNCDDIKKTKALSFDRIPIYDSQDTNHVVEVLIDYRAVIDTVIRNPIILSAIQKELNNSSSDNYQKGIDARIAATINYKNGNTVHLCIGNPFSNRIAYNDVNYDTNNHLLYLIKYNCGYYNWIAKEDLEYMEELSDPSFVRDSIYGIEKNSL